jgi:[ribosomal protein S18]-alanine N-acetyltransferase
VTIRAAEACDVEAIGRVQGRSSWRAEDFLSYDCRVAVEDGRVTGFLASRETAPGEREILFLAVDPAYRRRGIARGLVENELARGAGEWLLEVRESNVAAIALYESIGFKQVGRRREYYPDPVESAIVMRFFS